MKLIYIAGPFRASNAWEIEQNIRRAEAASLEVWRMGAACICPHTNTRFFQGAAPDDVWLEGDLEILSRCDAVLLVGDWKSSTGTKREITKAFSSRIPVLRNLDEVKAWLQEESA